MWVVLTFSMKVVVLSFSFSGDTSGNEVVICWRFSCSQPIVAEEVCPG